ncbi:hypothetical protein [Streptomyces sp. NPDC018000]|uniref:hypothetical protein n=1 Tax=Streptomyces sp. NPDC018000 TaxID=3365028 RepID=UPI0037958CDB
MPKKVLEFSVRTSSSAPMEEVRELLEGAFGCKFTEGEYERIPAFTTHTLGMQIGLFYWGGDYLLESRIADQAFLNVSLGEGLESICISEAVANTLTILGAGEWRVPSDADVEKDSEYAEEMEQRFLNENEPPSWASDS